MAKVDLNHLKVFERVARLGSFSAAARELGMPRSSVSRAVAALEEALATRLLQRSTRAVVLTEAGAALHRRSAEAIAELSEALDYMEGLGARPAGPLRVSAGIGLGIKVLAEHLPTFLERYPDIELDLHLESQRVELIPERIDVALRFGDLPDSSLVAIRLGVLDRLLCAAPGYLSRYGTPEHPEDLVKHRLLDMPTPDHRPRRWHFDGPEGMVTLELRPTTRVDEILTLHRLVQGGAGIAGLSRYLCEEDLESGRLVRLLPEWSLPPVTLSLLFPSRRELAPAVRACGEFRRESEPLAPWLR